MTERRETWTISTTAPAAALPAGVLLLVPPKCPRWALMWLLALAFYVSSKWLTWRTTRAQGAPWWRHLAYLFAWPGMDARSFLARPWPGHIAAPTRREWCWACAKFLVGGAAFFAVGAVVPAAWELTLGWAGMIALLTFLHFGLFDVLSCAWRSAGIDAPSLMRCPVAAESLAEFWGKRWNRAFRDLTHRFLFGPLAGRFGPRRALVAGFLFSGLLHDLVISLPAGGGYGGPTLFFALQAPAMLFERSSAGRAIGLGSGRRGWLFTMLVLTLPLFALFHPPFVRQIVLPFMRAVGAA
ncbi:MAG: hypothetical protein HYS13_17015 [Planctomycetia bacterium]|nr:hypothetical protein [Planctomycetia bacterium]